MWGIAGFAISPFIFLLWPLFIGGSDPKPTEMLAVISTWQTLLSCTFILLGATFTVRAVVIQIASAEQTEQARLERAERLDQRNCERELLAARSVLPLSLSYLVDYITAVSQRAHDELNSSPRPTRLFRAASTATVLSPPESMISDLRDYIRVAELTEGKHVADVISEFQVLNVYAHGCFNRMRRVNRDEYLSVIGRSAVLYGRVTNLFPYARREAETIEALTEDHVTSAITLWFTSPSAEYRDAAIRGFRYRQHRAPETAPPPAPATD